MAEAVRFELTGPVGPSVFKTDGLNHSPTFPILAPWVGFEPTTARLTVESSTVELPRKTFCLYKDTPAI